ncbi:MAG TPA: hypothetical protein VKE74_17400, partial [Gemmataceae bacterium]|nr:hypothetical protein [Gemmataceae bacterium]
MLLRKLLWALPVVAAAGLGAWATQLAAAPGSGSGANEAVAVAAGDRQEVRPAVTLPVTRVV